MEGPIAKRLIVSFKPNQKRGLLCPRKALLIQPVVIGREIAIDQRADEIEFRVEPWRRQKAVRSWAAGAGVGRIAQEASEAGRGARLREPPTARKQY